MELEARTKYVDAAPQYASRRHFASFVLSIVECNESPMAINSLGVWDSFKCVGAKRKLPEAVCFA